MFAFLGAIPIKDWIYGGLIVALLAGFGVYTIHERHEGAASIEAADARTAAVAAAKDKAIEAAAQTASNNIGTVYEKAVAIPAVADLGVSCVRNVAPAGSQLSKAAGSGPGAAQAAPVVGSSVAFDPSGAALTVGRDDDALIAALQRQVQVLLDAMNGQTK
jgi:hypothetical protein